MKIEKIVDRDLTAEEIESIHRFRSYTNGVSFACLCNRVMVMLNDEMSKDTDKLVSCAISHMQKALSEHPDFNVYTMEDNRILVFLNSGIFAFSEEPCEESLPLVLDLRSECLMAAEKMEILAFAYEEE